MGLFSRKKKETKKIPNFPAYEPQIKGFDKPLFEPIPEPTGEEFKIPTRKQNFKQVGEEKPLFVKIEKYKTAVRHIDEIKAKLAEAEKILRNLNKIKQEEEEEIRAWQEDIDNIKNKLLDVDKVLFEF